MSDLTSETVQLAEAIGAPSKDMRAISRCWQNAGWHAHAAGPCFDKYEQAVTYRDLYDACETQADFRVLHARYGQTP